MLNEDNSKLAEEFDYVCAGDGVLFILSKKKVPDSILLEKVGKHIPYNVKEWLTASELEIMKENLNSPKTIKALRNFADDYEQELEKVLAEIEESQKEGGEDVDKRSQEVTESTDE